MKKGILAAILSFIAVLVIIVVLWFLFYQPVSKSQLQTELSIESIGNLKELMEKQQQEFAKLSQALKDSQKANADKLTIEIEQLSRRLSVLEHDIAARPLPGALAKGSELEALKIELGKQYQVLARNVRGPRFTGFALIGLGMVQLKTAAASGSDFSAALNNISQIMPDNQLINRLRQFEKGVVSRAALDRQFRIAVANARQQSIGFITSPITAIFHRILKIRPLEESAGATPQALLSQLTARMKEGDLKTAFAMKPVLSKHIEAYEPLALWFELTKQRLLLDGLIVELDEQIYNLLAENIKKGGVK